MRNISMPFFKGILNKKKSKTFINESTRIIQGTTCEVEIVVKPDGLRLALKKFKSWDKHDHHKEICEKEYSLLKKLDHRCVIEALDFNKRKHIITFPCYSYTLLYLMKMSMLPTFEERALWFCQICEGVAYLHSQKVAHRDLKLENIMVDASLCNVKLIDFGAAVAVGPTEKLCHGICGSEPLMAPEVFQRLSYQGMPVDIWSLGIIMFEFFNNSNKPLFPWKIAKCGDAAFDTYLKDPTTLDITIPICSKLLSVDVNQRPLMEDVIQDSFFKENCNSGDEVLAHARTKRILERSRTI